MSLSPSEISDQLRALRKDHQETVKSPPPRAHTPRHVAPAPDTTHRRAPPHQRGQADQIELAVLAAIYQKPKTCLPIFAERGRTGFLVNPVHRSFLQLAQAYFEAHSDIEPNAFLQHLIDTGQLNKLGGPAFVGELLTTVSPPEAFAYHLDILRDKYVAREIAAQGSKLATSMVAVDEDELWTVVADHERAIADLRGLAADKLKGVETFDFDDLVSFDSKSDASAMLGTNRWLGSGYTCLWAGGSGYGKSTLEMQAAIYWATGSPLFGIPSVRGPLKSLIIQAENDRGDTAEQLQGVMAGIRASGDLSLNGEIKHMVVPLRLVGCSGLEFLGQLDALLRIHRPNLVWIDPLFAFAGCDLLNTEKISHFIRDGIIPIAIKHEVCAHVIHHIGKPARDNDAKKDWSSFDYQFLGFGSSEIQNAFRAVNILIPVSGQDGTFRLVLSKRGSRAGAKDPNGDFTTSLYISHATQGGLLWSQVDKPESEERRGRGRQPKYTDEHLTKHMSLIHPITATELLKKVAARGMGRSTFFRILDKLESDKKIVETDEGWCIKSQNSH